MKAIKLTRRHFLQGMIATLMLGGLSFKSNASERTSTLVVYLSRTKNNKTLAEYVASYLDADIAEIETAAPYPNNYYEMREQVISELDENIYPTLKNNLNTDDYQHIIIIFPTWSMRLPPPVKTFLNTHNLKGKIIMPLNTNAGYGIGSSIEEIRKLTPQADLTSVLSLKGGNERDGQLFVMQGEIFQQAKLEINKWLQTELARLTI